MSVSLFDARFDPRELEVVVSDLLIATADSSDVLLDTAVTEVLRQLRHTLKMDAVFVAEFVEGRRVFRFVDCEGSVPIAEGDSSPLEQSYCQRVVQGRMPELVKDVAKLPDAASLPPTPIAVGAHLSTPIVMPDGQAFGTLCCFSEAPNEALRVRDLATLRHCAQLVARRLNANRAAAAAHEHDTEFMAPEWSLDPIEHRRR
jgi:GAF domain-containing protein